MKKNILIFLSVFSLVTFTACDDRDEIRDDINALSQRLDALQVEFDRLNDNINTFYDLANGKIYFTSYSKDERGNYTLTLSDGTTWTVYGGMPEGELPVLAINDEGKWVLTYQGVEKVLESNANALPDDGINGVVPELSINDEGEWLYRVGDGEWQTVGAPFNIATIDKLSPCFFEDVKVDGSDNNILNFKLYGQEYINVPMLGGLGITFKDGESEVATSIEVQQGATETLTAELSTNATSVVISPTPLNVKLSEEDSGNLEISVPESTSPGDYVIYFEVYSDKGYRVLESITISVTAKQ